ncbi:MAG TPA: hypothetical protein VGI17_12220 [Solirubrobacterales bacterium]|jgi:hypothetical protein
MEERGRDATAKSSYYVLAAWKLPLIVAAIAFAIVGGFYVGGPGLGLAVGALAASSALVFAIVDPPRPPIVPRAAADGRDRLLLVVEDADPGAILTAAALAAAASEAGLEILILVPLVKTFLERWSEDVGPPRRRAQERVAFAMAELRRAGASAGGRIGDEDPVQAVADIVAGYPANQVTLVAASPRGDKVAAELRRRLTVPFMHLHGAGAGAEGTVPSSVPAAFSRG